MILNITKAVLLFATFLVMSSAVSSCKTDGTDPGGSQAVDSVSPQSKHSFNVGINRTDLYWVEGGPAAQTRLLNSIKSAGCEYVRFTLQGDQYKEAVRDHILYSNKIGIKPLVCIMLGGIVDIYPPGTQLVNRLQPGEERMFWDGYPVSQMDEVRFDTFMTNLLTYWQEAGCVIDVLELGNELNWIDFNGDFPRYPNGEGKIFDNSYTWNTLPDSVKHFARKAGYAAKKTKELASRIFGKDGPKVIVGGLSAGNLNYKGWMKSVGASVMDADVALNIMQGTFKDQPAGSENYLKDVDAVCLHLYPYDDCAFVEDNAGKADTTAMINDVTQYFDRWMPRIKKVTNLPVFITEFGYETKTYGIENDWKRAEQFKAFITGMERTKDKYNWSALYVYNWDLGSFQIYNNKPMPSADAIFK
ncbi:hypothetical protein [Chitinophaga sp. MM2321]|uniref:hypothetical protein n=1 Tax=Chitinophaga sp. MM2321 TaxID=3137178 RepID=UPI0032D59838